jgi:hypothetical protein
MGFVQWGSFSGVRSLDRLGFLLSFDPIYTSLHPSLIDRHLPSSRELVCEESSLDTETLDTRLGKRNSGSGNSRQGSSASGAKKSLAKSDFGAASAGLRTFI